ncbi:MAG: hypothetical protein ACP5G1_01500 [Nanopusillaceae archaeon]
MYYIYELCGKNDYLVKISKKIDLNSLEEKLKLLDFVLIEKNEDSIALKNNEKNILIYSFGEIIFINFSREEVINLLNKIFIN